MRPLSRLQLGRGQSLAYTEVTLSWMTFAYRREVLLDLVQLFDCIEYPEYAIKN